MSQLILGIGDEVKGSSSISDLPLPSPEQLLEDVFEHLADVQGIHEEIVILPGELTEQSDRKNVP